MFKLSVIYRLSGMIMLFFIGLSFWSCSTKAIRQPTDPPEILARVRFDNHKIGERYGNADVKRDFGTVKSWGTYWPYQRVRIARFDDPVHDKVLEVRYPRGKVRSMRSGASWFWKPVAPRQEAWFSYWVYFPDSLEFRAGGKLHGLVGGKANTGGNKPNGHDGWSCRVHWGENDYIKLYIYHKDQVLQWGDVYYFHHNPEPFDVSTANKLPGHSENDVHVTKGEWHHIMMHVKVNDIGQKNGIAQAWYDGKPVVNLYGFEFRDETVKPENLLIDGVYFSTFFGGRDERYKPVKNEYILFDDFILAKSMVCPPELTCEPISVQE